MEEEEEAGGFVEPLVPWRGSGRCHRNLVLLRIVIQCNDDDDDDERRGRSKPARIILDDW